MRLNNYATAERWKSKQITEIMQSLIILFHQFQTSLDRSDGQRHNLGTYELHPGQSPSSADPESR